MEYREIYCNDCKKILGRYNMRYYTDDKIAGLIRSNHSAHVRKGHEIALRRIQQ